MRTGALFVIAALAGASVAGAQVATEAPPPTHREFRLGLGALYVPDYESSRELRLALWDSPMSRLELALAGEQWAARHPSGTGIVSPVPRAELPLRLSFASAAWAPTFGPWSKGWDRLTWQDKVAAGAESGLLLWYLAQVLGHAR